MMSTGSIADSGSLLKSVFFPRAILPIATVLFNLTQYLLMVVVLVPIMMVAFRITPAAPMLAFPVFLLLQVLFTIGIALILATATTFFRDVRHLLEVGLGGAVLDHADRLRMVAGAGTVPLAAPRQPDAARSSSPTRRSCSTGAGPTRRSGRSPRATR